MISRDSFIKIMDGLRDYWDDVNQLYGIFNMHTEDNFLTYISDVIMDAISQDVEADLDSDEPWIFYFAFELDWGRADNAATAVQVDGVTKPLLTSGDLYDLIMFLREKE